MGRIVTGAGGAVNGLENAEGFRSLEGPGTHGLTFRGICERGWVALDRM